MGLRLVFMGTPDFSVPTLRALHAAGHEIAAVYCQPPRKAGRRGLALTPSPVQQAAEELSLPVLHPTSLKGQAEQEEFAALRADAAVVVAYGLILPQPILDAPAHGCFNGHASALPRWRGAAPIQRAIMAGDESTAMMVMKMEAGLDTGPIALEKPVPIDRQTTASELHDRLSDECAALMVSAMEKLQAGTLTTRPQPGEGVTYAAKIDKAETRIDFSADARTVHDHIRGLSPIPGAWTMMATAGGQEPQRVKILRSEIVRVAEVGDAAPGTLIDDRLGIACGEGVVRLTMLQKAGGRPVDGAEFLRGHPAVKAGGVLR